MRKALLWIIPLLVMGMPAVLAGGSAGAKGGTGATEVPGEVIVKLVDSTDLAAVARRV